MAEGTDAWLWTVNNRLGLFDSTFDGKTYKEAPAGEKAALVHFIRCCCAACCSQRPPAGAARPVSLMRCRCQSHAEKSWPQLAGGIPEQSNGNALSRPQRSAVEAIAAHHIWLAFLLQAWQVITARHHRHPAACTCAPAKASYGTARSNVPKQRLALCHLLTVCHSCSRGCSIDRSSTARAVLECLQPGDCAAGAERGRVAPAAGRERDVHAPPAAQHERPGGPDTAPCSHRCMLSCP